MATDSEVAAPIERTPPATPVGSPRPVPAGASGGRRGVIGTLVAGGLISGLIGFNAWWYRRDTRPVADSRTIEGWIGRGEYALAESALRERLRRTPHDGALRMTLARALAARGDLLGCARELREVPYWWPQRAEALFRAAQAFLRADHARDAEAALRAIMDADPLHSPEPGLYHDAGQELLGIYATEDRWEDAYPVIWKAYDHAAPPDRPLMLTMRLRCELERVSPNETLKSLRRYVAADPEDFEALRAMANAELAVGQRAEARRHLEACVRGRPDDPRSWRDYLSMLQATGEQAAFEAALALVPPSGETEPEIWMFRGQARERQGDLSGAAADYRKGLELNPNLLNAHYRLAMIEARLGHREQAASHRKRWDTLREARVRLRQANAEYRTALDAASAASPKPSAIADLRAALRRLASVCEDLGWARAVEACNQIAAGL
jgi:predicted Zn-dependent protease